MMKRLLVLIALVAGVGFVWYRRRRRADVGPATGDQVPARRAAADALVDDASADSFPASDAPAYWAREAADDAGA
jgi:hypothetical protein